MKKLLLSLIALTIATSVFAQGTVLFANRIAGTGTTHVYGPDGLLIGTVGGMSASTTFAQLIGAPGTNAPESSFLPSASPPTSFRTGAAAGNIVAGTATFNNIPPDAPVATFEMVAWDNASGLYPTWAQASAAWAAGLIAAGHSAPFNLLNIGGQVNTPPPIVSSIPGEGVQSFMLSIPEPTTAALAGLGAGALLIFRRRK